MKRPGPVGLTMLLTFTVVAVIELRTLLGMVGLDVETSVYYLVATALILTLVGVLYALPEDDQGNLSKA